jgi:DNA-binding beta-propeller fold protein YncE
MNTIIQKHIYAFLITHLVVLFSVASSFAEPSLIWEKKFDSRIVKTSRLMDMESKSGKRPDFPLRSVLTERSLFVLDNRGDIANKISLKGYSETTLSDDGMTMAGLKGNEIILIDLNNEVQGTVKIGDPQPEILPQHVRFELAPDGEFVVVLSSFSHTIYFHNRDGRLLSKEKVEDLKGAEIKFSDDSKFVVIHVPNWGKGKTNGYLLFFDDKGKKLWQFDHKGCQASFDVSADSTSIVMTAEDRLYSLNDEGNVFFESKLQPGDAGIMVSDDGGYVVVTEQQKRGVFLVKNPSAELIWIRSISDFNALNSPFTCLDVSEYGNKVVVAISNDWRRSNNASILFLLDKKGRTIWRTRFAKDRIHCNLSIDGRFLLIIANKEASIYKCLDDCDKTAESEIGLLPVGRSLHVVYGKKIA